jgi:diguanylate cyclase (GGDEF)-like protein
VVSHLTSGRATLLTAALTLCVTGAWLADPLAGGAVAIVAVAAAGLLLVAAIDRARVLAAREAFRTDLERALQWSPDDAAVVDVTARALAAVDSAARGELLLADAERVLLDRVAVSPVGPAGCAVTTLGDCLAAHSGSIQVARSSTALTACRQLHERPEGPCSAVCAPVSYAGVSLGAVHLTGPDGAGPSRETVERAAIVADRVGIRLGTLRLLGGYGSRVESDPLTGLLDREGLEERIRALVRSGREFALALADIDHLRDINEAFGHDEGDNALVLLGSVLRSTLRDADVLARFGGEEFALVFPEVDADGAARLLERVQFALGGAFAAGEAPRFTVSFGVADTTRSAGTEGAIADAEAALLLAKANGRNRIVVAERPRQ